MTAIRFRPIMTQRSRFHAPSPETPSAERCARARLDHPSTARASAKLLRDRADVKRLRRRGFKAAALDKEVLRQHNRRYTSVLPFGQIENQERSGNCWLFAPVVLVRAAALQNRRVTANATFSETYLYFFDLLEKARRSLFRVHRITARKEPLAGETVRQGLKHEVMGLADGGEWEWAFNLIEKYGLVPSHRMPGTASSDDTDALRVDLHERLARAARAIQSRPEKYTVIRDQALRDVVHILVAHLGTPPSDVRFRGRTLSPTEYAEQIIGFRACRMAGRDQQSVAGVSTCLRAAGRRQYRRRAALQPPPPQRHPTAAAGPGPRFVEEGVCGGLFGGRGPE